MSARWAGGAGAALLALAALGCAGGGGPAVQPPGGPPPAIATNPSGVDIRYDPDVRARESDVAAEPGAVWQALGAALAELELPVAEADAREGVMRTERFRSPRRIGGRPIAELFDCGSTISGRRTDNSDVYVELTSVVRAGTAGGSRVASMVAVTARSRGVSTAPVPCTSTGELEKLVVTRLRARLGG